MAEDTEDLRKLPLDGLHRELGARMGPFAGWDMPVQYAPGVLKEHLHCRAEAGLFDVSHMGQVILRGPNVAEALEGLVPTDIVGLAGGRQIYGLFTSPEGGVLDDLMIANKGDHLFLVVNAACAPEDVAHLRAALEPQGITVEHLQDRALLALQGPAAEEVLAGLNAAARAMRFMDVSEMELVGQACWISRSGYTGEDGYEISVPAERAEALARALLDHPAVAPIGLGARDSLRLEAGLCLMGHDMDPATTPVEAGLTWAIRKVRRNGGARAGGFPGDARILSQIEQGTDSLRVGLRPEGRAPMREGVPLYAGAEGGDPIGRITSGGFGPSVGGPVAMGYVRRALSSPGTVVYGELRGKRQAVKVAPLPFVPARFKR